MRANEIAVAHIGQGSRVTKRSQFLRRGVANFRDVSLMTTISAWAVGSLSDTIQFPLDAKTSPLKLSIITAPTGTSPRSAALDASIKANFMYFNSLILQILTPQIFVVK